MANNIVELQNRPENIKMLKAMAKNLHMWYHA